MVQLRPPGGQSFPNLLCVSLPTCRTPYPGGLARLLMTVTSSHILAFAILELARRPRTHKIRFIVACVTRLQVSLYATAHWVCSPCTGQDFYFRAFIPGDRSPRMSNITTWAYNQFPWPDFNRLDTQPYGLRSRSTRRSHKGFFLCLLCSILCFLCTVPVLIPPFFKPNPDKPEPNRFYSAFGGMRTTPSAG